MEIVVWSKSEYISKGQNSNIIGLAKKFFCNIRKNPNEIFGQSNICDEKKCGKAPLLQVPSLTVLPLFSLLLSLPSPLLFHIRLFIWNVFWITVAENLKTLGDIKCCSLMDTSGWSDFKSTKFSSRDTTALIGDILLFCGHCNADNTWCLRRENEQGVNNQAYFVRVCKSPDKMASQSERVRRSPTNVYRDPKEIGTWHRGSNRGKKNRQRCSKTCILSSAEKHWFMWTCRTLVWISHGPKCSSQKVDSPTSWFGCSSILLK